MSTFNGTADNETYAGFDKFVFGRSGSDRLTLLLDGAIASGGAGHDRITFGNAHQKVAGSSGNDTFVFKDFRSGREIVDFQTGSDKLIFEYDVFGDDESAFHVNSKGFLVFDDEGIIRRIADVRGHDIADSDILFA